MASVPAPAGIRKPQFSRRYQTSAEASRVGEAHHLVVVQLAQGRVHGKADGIAGAEARRAERA